MSNARKPTKPEAFDFDAYVVANREQKRETPRIKVGGKTFTLPVTVPLSVTNKMQNAKADAEGDTRVLLSTMQDSLRRMFGDAQWTDIEDRIGLEDVVPLFDRVFNLYAVDSGKSSGSGQN